MSRYARQSEMFLTYGIPLSHTAAKTESCGDGKARWCIGIGGAGEDVLNISSETDDVCSFSLEASTGHDASDPGELPVVSLYNEGAAGA